MHLAALLVTRLHADSTRFICARKISFEHLYPLRAKAVQVVTDGCGAVAGRMVQKMVHSLLLITPSFITFSYRISVRNIKEHAKHVGRLCINQVGRFCQVIASRKFSVGKDDGIWCQVYLVRIPV